ncbi:MAG: S8 family serine peptidase [Planctomycetota bacterium]
MLLRRLMVAVLAFVLVLLRAPVVRAGDAARAPREILVGMRDDPSRILPLSQQIYTFGYAMSFDARTRCVRVKLHQGVSVETAIAALQRRGDVQYAEPNFERRVCATPNDAQWSALWGLRKIGADQAWGIWLPHQTAVIAVLDTGAQVSHPDLANQMYRNGSNAVIGYNTINNSTDVSDGHSHGTHCCGTAAAQVNNGVGIAGVAGWQGDANTAGTTAIRIMPVKVLSDSGSGWDSDIAEGITWAADNGADVISMSLGGPSFSNTVNSAVQYAWGKGCVIVAAAGNSGSSSPSYPAAYSNVLSVAASDSNDKLTSFSNYGTWVKIAAPGSGIYSTIPASSYGYKDGTSMACPHVAGAAALLVAQNPSLSNSAIVSILTGNVDGYTPYASGRTIASGAGRMNVYKALLAAGNGKPVLKSLSLAPSTVAGGGATTLKVELSAAAGAGGEVVSLGSSDPSLLPVSSSVTVTQGATSASVSLTAGSAASDAVVTITATYQSASKTAVLNVRQALVLLDLDGSSGPDCLRQRSTTGAVDYWLLSGTTIASSGSVSAGGDKNLKLIATPDWNDDGRPDTLLQSTATGKLDYWLLNGTTIVSTGTIWNGGDANWRIVATPDLNGDAHPDLVWQLATTGKVTYWLMSGTSAASSGTFWNGGDAAWRVIGTPDLNADGKPDLLWQSSRNGSLTYWTLSGTTRIANGTLWAGGDAAWRVIGTPDLNGDGRPDLLWQSASNGKLTYWLMNGVAQVASGTLWNGGDATWKVIGTPDLNGDGKADLLWQQTSTSKATFWLLDQCTSTATGTISSGGDSSWKIVSLP